MSTLANVYITHRNVGYIRQWIGCARMPIIVFVPRGDWIKLDDLNSKSEYLVKIKWIPVFTQCVNGILTEYSDR